MAHLGDEAPVVNDEVSAYSSCVNWINLRCDEEILIFLEGSEITDLGLFVYDADGNLIVSSDGLFSTEAVMICRREMDGKLLITGLSTTTGADLHVVSSASDVVFIEIANHGHLPNSFSLTVGTAREREPVTVLGSEPQSGWLGNACSVDARSSWIGTFNLRRHEANLIWLEGDELDELEMLVYDAKGNLMAYGAGDKEVVLGFAAPEDGLFYVEIHNCGSTRRDVLLKLLCIE